MCSNIRPILYIYMSICITSAIFIDETHFYIFIVM